MLAFCLASAPNWRRQRRQLIACLGTALLKLFRKLFNFYVLDGGLYIARKHRLLLFSLSNILLVLVYRCYIALSLYGLVVYYSHGVLTYF